MGCRVSRRDARSGDRAKFDLREVVSAILFIAGTRCHGESRLPKEFPPYATVQGYWYAWRDDGRWEMINHAPVGAAGT